MGHGSKHNIALIIPAYEPNETLTGIVDELCGSFSSVVVVNDGSTGSSDVFKSVGSIPGVKVVAFSENKGKGAAIRRGIEEVERSDPSAIGAITIDADGQHLVEDIIRVAQALEANPDKIILGVRHFGRGTPFRSWWGNIWTRMEFRLILGAKFKDTQSGLRAFPAKYFRWLGGIAGERYEYETNVLVRMAKGKLDYLQVPIATVYEAGNATSHFRPLRDTLLTQKALFKGAIK